MMMNLRIGSLGLGIGLANISAHIYDEKCPKWYILVLDWKLDWVISSLLFPGLTYILA